jgi:tRNA threonylcarbamoyladenosine biosynthesis protein TsaB
LLSSLPPALVPTRLLAIDTATEICSVALACGDDVTERSEVVGQGHSERLLPMVDALLRDHGLRLADCDAIAFGAGPGAFTGLRIACGVAQGLAFGAGKPVVPVGNLAALALVAAQASAPAGRVLAAIDARMNEVYWALYTYVGGVVEQQIAPSLAAAAELVAICRQLAPDLVAGNALLAFPALAAQLDAAVAPNARASAAPIARLAARIHASGGAVAPALAAPLYVRDRVALTVDERRAAATMR